MKPDVPRFQKKTDGKLNSSLAGPLPVRLQHFLEPSLYPDTSLAVKHANKMINELTTKESTANGRRAFFFRENNPIWCSPQDWRGGDCCTGPANNR